jgi:hypothetical protein
MFNRGPLKGSDMASRRDWRRVGAASATLSAGALVFFAAGTAPAVAETQSAATTADECKLGKLLCGLLGAGSGTPAAPPKTTAAAKPTTKPKPKPKPKPAAKPAAPHHGSAGSGGLSVDGPPALPVEGDAPTVAAPESTATPALPEIAPEDPVVVPEAGGGPPSSQLVADSQPAGQPVPPLLVATASGLIGAVAALNLSLLRRRRQD